MCLHFKRFVRGAALSVVTLGLVIVVSLWAGAARGEEPFRLAAANTKADKKQSKPAPKKKKAKPKPAKIPTADIAWPPEFKGARDGVFTVRGKTLLQVPEPVQQARSSEGYAPFGVAKHPPTVRVAFHDKLGKDPVGRRLWSSWGDICVASDGQVYVGIGDHGHDAEGDARCFIYRWNPREKTLTQIVDMNRVVKPRPGQPAWSKVHAKIDEGPDGKIYFSCTLNAGNRAGDEKYQWTRQLPGAQLYEYDPATDKVRVFASLPAKRCTATSRYDAERNLWWCNLEAGDGDALFGLDLESGKVVYQGRDGQVSFNRNFALSDDGRIHFNGADGELWVLDPQTKIVHGTGLSIQGSPGFRASTGETTGGDIFAASHRTNQLFRYRPGEGTVEMLGPTFRTGEYTTVMEVSPDERFVYYLPGSHGQAFRYGTPVVQYNIATGERKVLAFLAPALEKAIGYVPGGTYGMKLSPDGSTLYVNFNGHAADRFRPTMMKPNGFGLCSFMEIEIPAAER